MLEQYAPDIDVGLVRVLSGIADSVAEIATSLRTLSGNAQVGSQNTFGDNQLEADVVTDDIVFKHLKRSEHVWAAASEETPVETLLRADQGPETEKTNPSTYSVAFDPLDGSSVTPANFAIGSIFGIWPGATMLGRYGHEQHAACLAVYGPRVTLAVALSSAVTGNSAVSFELTLMDSANSTWTISSRQFKVAPIGKVFAPGNLRATAEDARYMALVQHWITERYTLRYTGAMVPDVYHILCKSKGIFCNVPSESAPAKLRLLFEVAPVAFVMEAAGATTCTIPQPGDMTCASPLDVEITDLDLRLGVCMGSSTEVKLFKQKMMDQP